MSIQDLRIKELDEQIRMLESDLSKLKQERYELVFQRTQEQSEFKAGDLVEIVKPAWKRHGSWREPERIVPESRIRYRVHHKHLSGGYSAIRILKDGSDGKSVTIHSWDVDKLQRVKP